MRRILARLSLAAAMAVAGVAAGMSGSAVAADRYVVGISAAVTGRGSGTYAPVVEAMQLYIDQVNAAGGVNGHEIELRVSDNQAEPSRAAADARQFANDEDVILVVNTSLSSTYAPMVQTMQRAGVPLLFAGGVCPSDVYPPANRLLFCSTAYAAEYDSQFALSFIQDQAEGDVRLGLAAMAIPVSRGEIDYAEELAGRMGMTVAHKAIIPPPTADYTPFATQIAQADANWGYSWAPWVTQVKTFEALRRLGWEGQYLSYGHINAEEELKRIQDETFFVFANNAYFVEDLPIHREIREAAGDDSQYPVTQLSEGWIAGMVIEAIMKNAGWPADRESVIQSMNGLEVDTRGLRGGPIVWTESNHYRTETQYRVYRWDNDEQSVVRVQDWTALKVEE